MTLITGIKVRNEFSVFELIATLTNELSVEITIPTHRLNASVFSVEEVVTNEILKALKNVIKSDLIQLGLANTGSMPQGATYQSIAVAPGPLTTKQQIQAITTKQQIQAAKLSDRYKKLADKIPALSRGPVVCPVCSKEGTNLYTIIVCLNDVHNWPREEVADWLETLDVDLTLVQEGS
jgi:hypothetical protein